MDNRLRPKPRDCSHGVQLKCGHTVWGMEASLDTWLIPRFTSKYLWCPACIESCRIAGFWSPRA